MERRIKEREREKSWNNKERKEEVTKQGRARERGYRGRQELGGGAWVETDRDVWRYQGKLLNHEKVRVGPSLRLGQVRSEKGVAGGEGSRA